MALTKSQLRDLRTSNDSNQAKLLDHTQRQGKFHNIRTLFFMFSSPFRLCPCVDQEVVEKLAELDMMVADLERANSRVVTVERRNVRASRLLSMGRITQTNFTRSYSVRKLKRLRAGMKALTGTARLVVHMENG